MFCYYVIYSNLFYFYYTILFNLHNLGFLHLWRQCFDPSFDYEQCKHNRVWRHFARWTRLSYFGTVSTLLALCAFRIKSIKLGSRLHHFSVAYRLWYRYVVYDDTPRFVFNLYSYLISISFFSFPLKTESGLCPH